ncbi:MAG: recombinase family protein [Chloroflexota bacterium]
MINVALWLRVSDPDAQTVENQRPELETLVQHRGWQVARIFEVGASAYKGAHVKALGELYDGARRGEYQIVVTWAFDRLSREGPQGRKIASGVNNRGTSGDGQPNVRERHRQHSKQRDVFLPYGRYVGHCSGLRESTEGLP